MKEKKMMWIRYAICFGVVAVLCYLFPYTGDDWAWGSQIGIDRLNQWFENYNGRYVGNLIVLVMTRSNLLKAVIMSVGLTGIVALSEYIFKKKWAFYVSCVALVLMPKLILKQAVVWTAGYANYVTSLFLTLLFIAYVIPVFQSEMPKRKLWHCLPLFVLGVINTLIVEHLTIYNVVLSCGVIVYTLIAHHKVIASHVAYFLGTVAGAVYMFSNSAYHSIANNQDGYRQMAEGGVVSRAIDNYVNEIAKHLCLNNVWMNLGIFAVCFMIYQKILVNADKKRNVLLAKICLIVMASFNVWALLSSFGVSTYAKQNRLLYIEALFVAVYMVAIIGYSIVVGLERKCLWKMLFWNASIICVAAPLLVVNPIGERCFFATYALFLMLLLEFISLLEAETDTQMIFTKNFKYACLIICFAGLGFYLNIFSSIYQVDKERLARIERQVEAGKTTVEIRHLPYESYLWTATPEGEPWIERYKLFYGLPKNLKIKAVWEYSKKK